MLFSILIVKFTLLSVAFALLPGCIQPELECPNENITFWLYTRANQDKPHQLTVSDPESIKSAPWVKDAPVKILIHGYTGYKDFSPSIEIRPAYMECCDYNIISVDYNPIAKEPCYVEAAHNTELVGMCTAQLVDELVQNYGIPLNLIHPIGFSLGGQIVGFIANYLKSGQFERITALDPAMPLFVTASLDKKVDASDAKFVDVLHTNALEKGKLEPSGTVDFFANGGISQPGCATQSNQTKSGCDHSRAPAYYAESITTNVGFYSTKCYSWVTYMVGWCELVGSSDEILFGEYVPQNASGLYFFSTNSKSPYARGHSKAYSSDEEQGGEE
ncbi:pancreatic triacylglycerol lipase-like [Pectinophora gossypiella]|uniref:pancreatic triacylglycerol lipase-like n=1 Tax=Pectinophora gossypiella TaxID=13191 RepID=UPI00214EDD0F|nr:pancreatic triacylglycerol lipase-like [Pectinophora gossypiella]